MASAELQERVENLKSRLAAFRQLIISSAPFPEQLSATVTTPHTRSRHKTASSKKSSRIRCSEEESFTADYYVPPAKPRTPSKRYPISTRSSEKAKEQSHYRESNELDFSSDSSDGIVISRLLGYRRRPQRQIELFSSESDSEDSIEIPKILLKKRTPIISGSSEVSLSSSTDSEIPVSRKRPGVRLQVGAPVFVDCHEAQRSKRWK
jgi:hypothetical protein